VSGPTELKERLHDGKFTFTVVNDKLEHFTYRLLAKPSKYKKGGFFYYARICKMPDGKSPDLTQRPEEDFDAYRIRLGEEAKRWRWNCVGLFDTYHAPWGLEPKDWADFAKESVEFRVCAFALRIINGTQKLPPGYAINQATFCRKCGRLLWQPVSQCHGYGPECRRKLGIAA
jgi:hypothetical protein